MFPYFFNSIRDGCKNLITGGFCIFVFSSLFAQKITVHHPDIYIFLEDSIYREPLLHSAYKPYTISLTQLNRYFGDNRIHSSRKLFLAPVLESSFCLSKENNSFYRFGQGFFSSADFSDKVGFEISAVFYEQSFPEAFRYSLDSLRLIPRFNRYIYKNGKHAGYLMLNGFVYWRPLPWLTLKAGNDKHFIGDGYRSLFLSENAASSPFLQTRLKIWKIDYLFQSLWLRDLVPGLGEKRFQKYATMHTLSFNLSKRMNLYIFETVIWRAKDDSARHRSFDLQYLNPFLFFRPAEYNMGSPDNVLIGFGGKYRIGRRNYVYGQLLLDEFRLQELKANKGWWGNKYAYQFGFKTYGLTRKFLSMLLFEYNQARPFTWSHSFTLQNYGYLSQPLAHPLGANFREFTGVFRMYLGKKWTFSSVSNFAEFGTNPPDLNYGADIYVRQWTFSKFNGNYTTQGIRNTSYFQKISLSRMLVPAWRLRAEITFSNYFISTEGIKNNEPGVEFGLRTLLYE